MPPKKQKKHITPVKKTPVKKTLVKKTPVKKTPVKKNISSSKLNQKAAGYLLAAANAARKEQGN